MKQKLRIGDAVGVQAAHCINSTSPVELQYCLRTKMYAIKGCFLRFSGSVSQFIWIPEWSCGEKIWEM